MPILQTSNTISISQNGFKKQLESKETKKSKKFIKNHHPDVHKKGKSPLQTDNEKFQKTRTKARKPEAGVIATFPGVLVKNETIKSRKPPNILNGSKKTERQESDLTIKTALPTRKKTIRISVSKNEVIPSSRSKNVKKVSKPKTGKPSVDFTPKTKKEDSLKRSTAGTHEDENKNDNFSSSKKESQNKKIVSQSNNFIKSGSQIQKEMEIKGDHQKIAQENLTKSKDLEKKKKIKTNQKPNFRSPISSTNETEQKKNKSVVLKEPTDSVRRKQRVSHKNLSRKIVEEKVKDNVEGNVVLKTEVKFDSQTHKEEAKAIDIMNIINKEKTNMVAESPTITEEPPSTSVARPDLLKFVRAMKENVQFESIQPGTESYQDLVQNTLKSVFSTVNKFHRKDPLKKFKNYGKQNDDALMITPNLDDPSQDHSSRVSAAGQMFEHRANIAQTSQPFQRALKESKFAELKFLEQRKAQAQPVKPSFLKSLHVGPNFPVNSPSNDLKTTPSETAITSTTFDAKAIKMAQRYSNDLEEARIKLSQRLNAL